MSKNNKRAKKKYMFQIGIHFCYIFRFSLCLFVVIWFYYGVAAVCLSKTYRRANLKCEKKTTLEQKIYRKITNAIHR